MLLSSLRLCRTNMLNKLQTALTSTLPKTVFQTTHFLDTASLQSCMYACTKFRRASLQFRRTAHFGGPDRCWTTYKLRPCVRASAVPGGDNGTPDTTLSPNGYKDPAKSSVEYVFTDPANLKLQRRAVIAWPEPPQNVLLVKKAGSKPAAEALQTIAHWLTNHKLKVLVELPVAKAEFPDYEAFDGSQSVDFCVTLGGDGTVLHLATLFDKDDALPPVVSFAMGTLGFLTPFNVQDYQTVLTRVVDANRTPVYCTLRARKTCEAWWDGKLQRSHNVLNEVLIDRGGSASMVQMELVIDGYHVTTVQADGLIIATPSGSTAYSMSAGGPMVAPSVPCGIITPIAPHSLSFRPIIIPESSDVEVHIPLAQRSHARMSFDGRHAMRLPKGGFVRCHTSLSPIPSVNLRGLDEDWYEGIVAKLKWNVSIRENPPRRRIIPDLLGTLGTVEQL